MHGSVMDYFEPFGYLTCCSAENLKEHFFWNTYDKIIVYQLAEKFRNSGAKLHANSRGLFVY